MQPATADPALKTLRQLPAARHSRRLFARLAETHWRTKYIDPFGQVFTPFVSVRGDAAPLAVNNEPGVSNFIPTGETP